MKTKLILLFLTSFLIYSCLSPQKALDKKQYKTAFWLSSQKIKYKKEVDKNIRILQTSADHLVDNEIKRDAKLLDSYKVKDWVKVQDRYYKLLEDIGKANIISDGALLPIYDDLCTKKQDVDFKIVDYYYQRGIDFLNEHYKEDNKKKARDAYYQFVKAEESGAHIFYSDINDLINESRKRGVVYYICHGANLGNKMFFKKLPRNADFEPDCVIDIDFGSINYDEIVSEDNHVYTKEILVRTEEEKDTSGNITYRSIYEKISATVTTTETKLTLSTTTWVDAENVTGQCTKSSKSYTSSVSGSYEEVRVEGDKDALDYYISEDIGEPAFFRSNLESELERKIMWEL